MTTVKDIYNYIESIAPFDTQEEWDNSGLLCGDFESEVKTVVAALDPTKEVCAYAESVGADLLLTHHPLIFRGVKSLIKGDALYTLTAAGISHIAAHTNFDLSERGINFNLARLIGLQNPQRLGDSFIVAGSLENGMSIDDFAELLCEKLGCAGIRFTDTDRIINTVAVGGGACEEYIDLACKNADCFVTGDLKYHQMLDAREKGFTVVSAGHFETENKPFRMLADDLKKVFNDVEFLTAPCKNPICTV